MECNQNLFLNNYYRMVLMRLQMTYAICVAI